MTAVVCIPIYKIFPDVNEIISLRQVLQVLSSREFIFVHPADLQLDFYKREITNPSIRASFRSFSNSFFSSTRSYNRLVNSIEFISIFSTYDYFLIYQLDAYVFQDNLDYWCSQGYSYIGAPCWQNNRVWVGNGGFSLRKTQDFLAILNHPNLKCSVAANTPILTNPLKSLNWKGKFFSFLRLMNILNSFNDYLSSGLINEDAFWGELAHLIDSTFRVPDWEIAANFSFDQRPDFLYRHIGNCMPFGCHAWHYHASFWIDRKLINIF